MAKNRRDGSKLSFAERDKLRRERRDGVGRDRKGSSSAKANYAQKSYKAALERAFADGRVEEFAATLSRASAPPSVELPKAKAPAPPTPAAPEPSAEPAATPKQAAAPVRASNNTERRKLIDKIKIADTGRDIGAAVDRYLAKFETLPNDYEVLERALAHPKPHVVCCVLEQLITQLDRSKPRRSRSLAMQLQILEDTADDAETRELARTARSKL